MADTFAVKNLRKLVLVGLSVCALMAELACSSEPENPVIPRGEDYSPAGTAGWRGEEMPKILGGFAQSNRQIWGYNRDILLSDPRTPRHIQTLLNKDDWASDENRSLLVEQGLVYEQLNRFNSDERAEWRMARIQLVSMGEEIAAVCAWNLGLRLNSTVDQDETASPLTSTTQRRADAEQNLQGTMHHDAGPGTHRTLDEMSGAGFTSAVPQDRALWAMEELVAIGEPAVQPLLDLSRLVFTSGVSSGPRFTENVWQTLAGIGEPAVPYLLQDLEISQDEDDPWRFHRCRLIVRSLGDIYGPHKVFNPDYWDPSLPVIGTERPAEWLLQHPEYQRQDSETWYQEVRPEVTRPVERSRVLRALADLLEDYEASNDSYLFQIRNYIIRAFIDIGEPWACRPLVALWQRMRQSGEEAEEDDLMLELRLALRTLSARGFERLSEWQDYTESLPRNP